MASDTDKNAAATSKPIADETRRKQVEDGDAGERKSEDAAPQGAAGRDEKATPSKEVGGRGGLDPTRYGDWEINGRCVDF